MQHLGDWSLWRLVWDATERKYEKKPCDLRGVLVDGAGHPSKVRYSYAVAKQALDALWEQHPPRGSVTYTLGFWMTEGCGYWFFDLDNAVGADGQVLPLASQLSGMFPGAMMEWSTSGRGLHVMGRGEAPPHRTKPTKET